jgi:hypothetical protein
MEARECLDSGTHLLFPAARQACCSDAQALAARGEPLMSGFNCSAEGMAAYFGPQGWQLTELLGPK